MRAKRNEVRVGGEGESDERKGVSRRDEWGMREGMRWLMVNVEGNSEGMR